MTVEKVISEYQTLRKQIIDIFVSEIKKGNGDRIRNDKGYLSFLWLESHSFKNDGTIKNNDLLNRLPNLQRERQRFQITDGILPPDTKVTQKRERRSEDTKEAMVILKND